MTTVWVVTKSNSVDPLPIVGVGLDEAAARQIAERDYATLKREQPLAWDGRRTFSVKAPLLGTHLWYEVKEHEVIASW